MPWLATATVVGVVVLAVLIWFFLRTRSADLLADILAKRKATAKIATVAQYCEALNRMPVALSLTDDTIYYENPDLQASFELSRIDEIEYDDELVTAQHVANGCRALRLRAHGAAFEFILDPGDCEKWMAVLPPRNGMAAAHAV